MNTLRLLLFLVAIFGFLVITQSATHMKNTSSQKTSTPPPTESSQKVTVAPSVSPTGYDSFSWKYPGATEQRPNEYMTSNSPFTVTTWYKKQIKSLGFTTTAISQTAISGNVTDTLVASQRGQEVRIVISKKATDSSTYITITTK